MTRGWPGSPGQPANGGDGVVANPELRVRWALRLGHEIPGCIGFTSVEKLAAKLMRWAPCSLQVAHAALRYFLWITGEVRYNGITLEVHYGDQPCWRKP